MTEIARNRWGQPLIIPLGEDGQPDLAAKLVPYKRVSKFAKMTDDTTNLSRWQRAMAALGLAHRVDLFVKVQGILATNPEPLSNYNLKKQLHAILDDAHVAAGGQDAADRGTYLHTLTEYHDQGAEFPEDTTADDIARIEEYGATLEKHGVEVLAVENFVVNDEYRTAGTFDRLVRLHNHGGIVVSADVKTGKWDDRYPNGVASQLENYSGGSYYDPDTGERTPIHPELDRTKALLIHMPNEGEGTHLYSLDLVLGRQISLAAQQLAAVRKIKAAQVCTAL